jgi:hypothetical protein
MNHIHNSTQNKKSKKENHVFSSRQFCTSLNFRALSACILIIVLAWHFLSSALVVFILLQINTRIRGRHCHYLRQTVLCTNFTGLVFLKTRFSWHIHFQVLWCDAGAAAGTSKKRRKRRETKMAKFRVCQLLVSVLYRGRVIVDDVWWDENLTHETL